MRGTGLLKNAKRVKATLKTGSHPATPVFCDLLGLPLKLLCERDSLRGLPGGPEVKPSPSSVGGEGSIPDGGANIPHTSQAKKPKR